jgi:hypothetical protein
MPVLHQVIALDKGAKSRTLSATTELYKTCQKPELFNGVIRKYTPRNDSDERLPDESKLVQKKAEDVLVSAKNAMSELFDITAARDFTNCKARATVKVDGVEIIKDAPVTYLLFLEKQLTDIRTLVSSLPVLDPAHMWKDKDPNSGLYSAEPTESFRTKKQQVPLVLAPATDKFPAQTQLITDDVTAGTWKTTVISGAIPGPRRDLVLERVDRLIKAVKSAREEANGTTAELHDGIGAQIFGYLFA